MNEHSEKKGLLTQTRRMLISGNFLENETIITPLQLFYPDLGVACQKIDRLVQDTPMKCFNKFVQSVVNASREGDENLNSSVVAQRMKLLANKAYGYQIMDRSQHTVKNCFSDKKHIEPSITKCFKVWVI